jgi:hypothetical protein
VTIAQHQEAREYANEVRMAAGRFRREVSELGNQEGKALLAAYLEKTTDLPPEIDRMPVDRFVASIRRIGDHEVERLYRVAGLHRRVAKNAGRGNPTLQVRDLTDRERLALAAALRPVGVEVEDAA